MNNLLPLVAIALFLIDNGCNWTAINNSDSTAAEEIWPYLSGAKIRNIFQLEGHRHYAAHQIMAMPSTQLPTNIISVGNKNYALLQQSGRTMRTNIQCKNSLYKSKR